MGGKYLLDTNIVIALFAEDDRIEKLLNEADYVLLPSIVLGELYFGAHNSHAVEENLARVTEFANMCPVIGPTTATAMEYGRIKKILKHNGTPIPENDIWIAALASQFNLQLLTRDEHFSMVEGIALLSP
jgi:tRNA(fMet)-specific endonuclease VapC